VVVELPTFFIFIFYKTPIVLLTTPKRGFRGGDDTKDTTIAPPVRTSMWWLRLDVEG
jgi:hypothetical protein